MAMPAMQVGKHKPDFAEVERNIMINLADLGPYRYKKAASGSVYLKFKDPTLGSLRIGNHEGREKYRYRWNIREDIKEGFTRTRENGRIQYFYTFYEVEKLVDAIRNYAQGAYLYEY